MNEIWHYTDLLKAHSMLLREEGRLRFYETYMTSRDSKAWLSSPNPTSKDILLLFGWLHTWDPNYDGDVLILLEKYAQVVFPIIKGLVTESIFTIDLTTEYKDKIELIFNELATCGRPSKTGYIRFESTDTSKIMHAIIPELFVMWDIAIKKNVIGFRSSGRDYAGDCYAKEFLPKMQDWATVFLDSFVRQNGGDYLSAITQISTLANGYTLAKLLDELNYLMFTMRKPLKLIREEKI